MAFSREELKRYSRQIAVKEIGIAGQQKRSEGSVLVSGAGGLGSSAQLYLAAAGVGRIGIADYDRVDLSNLERQIIHRTDRIGMEKTKSAAMTLQAINPEVRTELYQERVTPDNITDLIRPYDIVLDATDHFENKLLVNDACVLAGKPFVHAGVLAMSGQIMTWLPGEGPCLRCLSGSAPGLAEMPSCREAGVVGAAVSVISSLQAMEAIRFLIGKGKLLTGRLLHYDGLTCTFDETEIPEHSPWCRVCGEHPDIRSLTDHPEEYVISCGA